MTGVGWVVGDEQVDFGGWESMTCGDHVRPILERSLPTASGAITPSTLPASKSQFRITTRV